MKSIFHKHEYEQIEDNQGGDEAVPHTINARRKCLSAGTLVLANFLILALSIVLLVLSIIVYWRAEDLFEHSSDRNSLLRSTLYYSPIIKTYIPFGVTKFTSAPLSSKNESIYRQPPGPEVDEAWNRLTDIGTHILSSSEVRALGKDPAKAVRVPTDWGYGPDAHIATIDGIHLVHCLNSMRKSLHVNFEYYYYHPSQKDGSSSHASTESDVETRESVGPEYLPHLTHCIEAVLQHLLCNPSMELLTQNWIPRQHEPFPDFAVNKKCWDYEAILKWKEDNRVKDIEERFEELRPPVGAIREPMPPLVAETWDYIEGRKSIPI